MSDTTAGIDKLIARIRRDAVEEGNDARARIVQDARAEAQKITNAARDEAEAIVERARDEARELRKRMNAELRMTARDFVTGLGQRLRDHVIEPAVREEVAAKLADPGALAAVIGHAVGALATREGAEVIVGEEQVELLGGAVWQRIEAAAAGDLHLRGEHGITGFKLVLKGQHIVWDFTDETIASELTRFVAPALREHFYSAPRL